MWLKSCSHGLVYLYGPQVEHGEALRVIFPEGRVTMKNFLKMGFGVKAILGVPRILNEHGVL